MRGSREGLGPLRKIARCPRRRGKPYCRQRNGMCAKEQRGASVDRDEEAIMGRSAILVSDESQASQASWLVDSLLRGALVCTDRTPSSS